MQCKNSKYNITKMEVKYFICFSNEKIMCDFRTFKMILTESDITHINLEPICGTKGNRIAPDVTPQNVASHLRLFCLLS